MSLFNSQSANDVALGFRFLDVIIRLTRKVRLGRNKFLHPYILLAPSFILISLLAFGVASMFWRGMHSFDAANNIQSGLSLEHYRRLFSGFGTSFYMDALVRTIVTSFVVTFSAVLFALPAAYTIVRTQTRRWRRVALIILLVPFMMGETVRTIGWFLIMGRSGALPWATAHLGNEVNLLGSTLAIWIGMLQVMFPIATLVLLPAITRINPDLERAAQSMGATSLRIWLRILLPLARPGIVSSSLVVFTLSMTEYAIPRILGLGKHPFVANTIQQIYFERGNINFGSAFSTVLLVTVVVMVSLIGFIGRAR